MSEVGQVIANSSNAYKINIYEPSTTTTYLCLAAPGSLTSSEAWRIMKIDTSTAGVTLISFADGNKNFDNIADDRAALSYS